MNPKQYATPAAFRRALEDRLLQLQRKERQDLQRLRRQVAFDRLLGSWVVSINRATGTACPSER